MRDQNEDEVPAGRPIRGLTELVTAVAECTRLVRHTAVWWRGHADATCSLVPGAFRGSRDRADEADILRRFRRKARVRNVPAQPPETLASWLFLCQHYGVPTRLLDWTESPLLALYFAVRDLEDRDGTLWMLDSFELNFEQLERAVLLSPESTVTHEFLGLRGLEHEHETFRAERLFEEAFNEQLPGTPGAFAIMPDELDLRMQLQLTMFTIHGHTTPLEESNPLVLRRFVIPGECKRHLRWALRDLGIRESNIFPDLDHLASELVWGHEHPEAEE